MPGHNMGSATTAPAASASDPMTIMLQPLNGAAFEVNWMQLMIVHHQGAVDMAKLAKTNTKRPELLKLADDIIKAQNTEIEQMTRWLANWHNAKPIASGGAMDHSSHGGAGMSMPSDMMMGMGDMNKLKAAKDAAFDKLFLPMMIEHHQQAINMSNLVPAKSQRPELVKLSQEIVKAQNTEIEQMKGWQKAWFPA